MFFYNRNTQIPDENVDIQQLVRSKFTRLLRVWGIWTAVLVILEAAFMFSYFASALGVFNSVIIAVILFVLPFFFMKGHKLLTDRAWEGVIADMVYDRVVKVNGRDMRKIVYRYELTMTIDLGGTYIFHTLPCSGASMRYSYKAGDRVRKYYGLMYPIYTDTHERSNQICPVCGFDVEENLNACLNCGHSRINL